MLDNLVNLVKQYAGDEVNNNPAIPADKKVAVVEETSNSITGSLQKLASGGGLNDLLGMFTQRAPSGNVSQTISGDVASNLTNKVGLDSGTASGFAGGLIPKILGDLVNKTNDPGDSSFNLQSIINELTGGKTSGTNLSGMLGKLKSGLDKDGDGDVDFQDAMKLFGK